MKPYTWRQAIIRSDLSSTTRHVLLTVACHINDAGESAYPSIDLLAFETGLSRRAVITHLQSAAALGWIRTSKHGYGGQRWARNEYDPCIPDGFVPIDPPNRRPAEGGEPDDKKVVNDDNHLFRKAVNDVPEGGEPDDKKVVNDVHSNRPKELSIEQTTLLASSATKKTNKPEANPEFEEAWRLYPKRDGGNSKADALRQWNARLSAGVDPDDMLAGVKRYAAHCVAKGKIGTEFVMQGARFFGKSQQYAETWAQAGQSAAPRDESTRRLAW